MESNIVRLDRVSTGTPALLTEEADSIVQEEKIEGKKPQDNIKSIEQIVRLSIAVYEDYCKRGFNSDIARRKAIHDVIESTKTLTLIEAPDDGLADNR